MSEQERRKKARRVLASSGYKMGGSLSSQDRSADRHDITEAVHQHEEHDHPGAKKTRVRFKDGGHVDGFATGGRSDRAPRGKSKSKGGTKVNVIVAPQGGAAHPPMPMPMPAPHPPMAGMPPGGPPPGMPPQRPPMPGGMKKGGRAHRDMGGVAPQQMPMIPQQQGMGAGMKSGGRGPKMTASAANGEGRREKAEHEEKSEGGKRRSGGKC